MRDVTGEKQMRFSKSRTLSFYAPIEEGQLRDIKTPEELRKIRYLGPHKMRRLTKRAEEIAQSRGLL
jgi:hypothetical protein